MTSKILPILLCLLSVNIAAQNEVTALTSLRSMLEGQAPQSFKKAVLTVENVFLAQPIEENDWNYAINSMVKLTKTYAKNTVLTGYKGSDSSVVKLSGSLFKVMTDTVRVIHEKDTLQLMPFQYDFEDIFGSKDWTKMFVSKLLATHKGNCHSMPYLYKIVCEELAVPCHLSLAPNHIYIKQFAQNVGWFNTELTSGAFPIDAWLMASGFISLEAVQKGTYMDTLSQKESIALCVVDLAKGYQRKYPTSDGNFIITACDLALTHYPKCLNALILKAETLKKQFEQIQKQQNVKQAKDILHLPEAKTIYTEMNRLYAQIHKLGFRSIPESVYREWLFSLQTQKEKYQDKKVSELRKN